MKWYLILGTVILGVAVAFVSFAVLVGTPYKDCGSSSSCLSDAIRNCERAKGTVSTLTVKVQGERSVAGGFGGVNIGVIQLCEINFKRTNSEKTCLLPSTILMNQYSIWEYEMLDKFCAAGSSPPSSSIG